MKTLRRVSVVLAAFAAVFIGGTTAAAASESDAHFKLVVWQMPVWDEQPNQGPKATWPQTFVSAVDSESPDLEAVELPECGYFQVDAYRYDTKNQQRRVDALIAGGVLNGPNDPVREPLASARLFNQGRCDSPPLEVTAVAPVPFNDCPDYAGVTLTFSEGVLFSVDDGVADGVIAVDEVNQVSFGPGPWTAHVTATAADGYVLVGQTEWTFTGVLEPCPSESPSPTPSSSGPVPNTSHPPSTLPATGPDPFVLAVGLLLLGAGVIARLAGGRS